MTGDSEKIRVTLISNAGLLLEYRGVKLILDGIYSGDGHPFDAIPQDIWDRELSGQPPFDGVGYLLFTHCHADHFSPGMTLEYLKRNAVKSVFLPEAYSHGELTEYLRNKKVVCVPLSENLGRTEFSLSEGISLRAIKTKHLDKRFADVEHYCFLLRFGEKKLLFTGDADYVTESFRELNDTELDAVFLNPLFFSAVCRQRFFSGSFDTGLYCVYHLPVEADDGAANRTIKRELQLWDEKKGRVVLLNKKGQSLEI